jgi:transposase
VPALPPYIIEPIWEQFRALLPEREVNHPLGCHRSRIPDWVVFDKLVQILVFGCAYRRIADQECSATTLRDRRDEWMACEAMETLRTIALEAYDRLIGLELADMAVDSCITKAPCGGEKAGKARWIGQSRASNARRRSTDGASPLAPSPLRPTATTRHC